MVTLSPDGLRDFMQFAVDIVSAIEFDETGEFIAAGDRGGRVVVFEKAKQLKKNALPEYKFYCEFQSHEPEFDPLKSLEIEEKINKIKWCRRQNPSHLLLTTNGKDFHYFDAHFLETILGMAPDLCADK